MIDKNVCDVCRRKVNKINNIANVLEGSVLCSRCYEKLEGFKIIKKYQDVNVLEEERKKYVDIMHRLDYPQKVIDDLQLHFDKKRNFIIAENEVKHYLVSTSSYLEGYTIDEYLGVVSGHVVVGPGFFSSFNATVADWTGSEADTYTDKLDSAQEVAQRRAILKSMQLGGNALIAIDIEHTTFFRDLMGVVVTGTSVKVHKNKQIKDAD